MIPTNSIELRARAFEIIKSKSFAVGEFELSSGERSNHYFDLKPTMFDPEGADILSELVLQRIEGLKCDYIGGLEMGAVPLISPINAKSFLKGRPIPGFFVRKQAKAHGTRKKVEGVHDLAGKSIVIVDDVTTSGKSAMQAVKELQDSGAIISLVISIVDRQQGAADLYKAAGIPFQSLFTASEFLGA